MERKANRLVLDASVAAKWFIREDYRDRALKLRDAHAKGDLYITAPDLVVYEIINALRFNPELSEMDIKRAVTSLFQLYMELHQPTIELIEITIANAFKYSISIYDATYLSLAELQNCPAITADEEFYEKTSSNKHMMLLSADAFPEWFKQLRQT